MPTTLLAIFVNSLVCFNFLLFIGVLLYKRTQVPISIFLFVLFLTPLLYGINNLSFLIEALSPNALLLYGSFLVNLLFPFAYYYYFRSFLGLKTSYKSGWSIMLYVVLILFTFLIGYYDCFSSNSFITGHLNYLNKNEFPLLTISNASLFILNALFFTKAFILSRRLLKWSEAYGGATNKLNGKYLLFISLVSISVLVIMFVLYLTIDLYYVALFAFPIAQNLVFAIMLFSSFRFSSLFQPKKLALLRGDVKTIKTVEANQVDSTVQSTSTYDTKDVSAFLKRIKSTLNKNELYKQKDLTVFELSNEMKINPVELLSFLNHNLGLSFYDFINKLRAEAAAKLITNPNYDNFTLLGIGLEVGFDNETSFQRAFKKFIHNSPENFRLEKLKNDKEGINSL